jgi:hypothetical protein
MCVDSPALRAPPQEGDASGRGGKVKTRIVRDVLTPPPCGHPLIPPAPLKGDGGRLPDAGAKPRVIVPAGSGNLI